MRSVHRRSARRSAAIGAIAAITLVATGPTRPAAADDAAATRPALPAAPRAAARHRLTPLSEAIVLGDKERAVALIREGADPDDAGEVGKPPLYFAAGQASMLDVVKLLVEHGAAVNPPCRDGYSPLHYACEGGSAEAVEYLLSKGADVGARDSVAGTTPLHAVAEGALGRDRRRMIQALLKHGADVNALDKDGQTPLDLAVERERTGLQALLRAAGALPARDLPATTQPAKAGD